MRTFSRRTAALAMLATVLVAAGAYAADPPATPQQPHQRGAWLQQKLGLSDTQMQQIREIRQRDFQALKQSWQQLRQAQAILPPDQREAYAKLMDHGPRGHRHMRQPAQPQQGS